jgi:hypothetical protein
VHFDQDFIVFRRRFLHLFELKNFRTAVSGCYDSFQLGSFLLKIEQSVHRTFMDRRSAWGG